MPKDKNPRNAGRKPMGDQPKKRTTVCIDEKVWADGRDAGLNFSQLLEQAIRQALK